tara:strand:- start:2710 stop:2961 length:252 start_codon:yes stop_codon:yes gene_type:complete
MKRQDVADEHGADLLFLSEEYFDGAIVGVTDKSQVVYDMDLMVDLFATNNECTEEEAIEYLDFNTWCAYVGDETPVFITRCWQ